MDPALFDQIQTSQEDQGKFRGGRSFWVQKTLLESQGYTALQPSPKQLKSNVPSSSDVLKQQKKHASILVDIPFDSNQRQHHHVPSGTPSCGYVRLHRHLETWMTPHEQYGGMLCNLCCFITSEEEVAGAKTMFTLETPKVLTHLSISCEF